MACHYCEAQPSHNLGPGDPGFVKSTRDHIVPRLLTPPGHYLVDGVSNLIRACEICNVAKGHARVVRADGSDHCETCSAAWAWYGPSASVKVSTITIDDLLEKSRAARALR